jgi:hypothetical protein
MAEELTAEAALASALTPVLDLDSALAAKEGQLKTELESVRIERRKLASVLRVLDPERSTPGAKPGKTREVGRRTVPYAIAEHVVESVREIILGFEGEEFSTGDIYRRFDLDGSTSEHARKDRIVKSVSRLRERGQVRLVAQRRGKGGGSVYVATERIGERSVEITSASNGA